MRKITVLMMILIIGLPLFSGCEMFKKAEGEDEEPGKIIGTVSHTEAMGGGAIQSATVQAGQKNAYTDSKGYYELELSPGSYSVTASKKGYESKSSAVSVADNSTTICSFILKKYTSPNCQIKIEDSGNYTDTHHHIYGYASGTIENTGDCSLRKIYTDITFYWQNYEEKTEVLTFYTEILRVDEKLQWSVKTQGFSDAWHWSVSKVESKVRSYSYDSLLSPAQNK